MGAVAGFKRGIKAVDLFCGVGGLTCGLQESGIRVVAGIDNDPSCEYAYSINNKSKFLTKDIRSITKKEIDNLWGSPKIKILAGCAPCQTFSKHTEKNKKRQEDERWGLLYHFLELVKKSKPNIVTMENVPQLRNYRIFDDFVKGLKKLKFHVSYKVVQCTKYGIPQRRSRLVLLASKFGEISLIPETHKASDYISIKDIIGKLKPIKAGQVSKSDSLHRSWKLSSINKKRISQSKPGGTWLDWDKKIRLPCHKKSSGKSYTSVYGRMKWSDPAPTITTQFFSYGTGRFGHPKQHRAISLREGALIQTFPKNYKFYSDDKEISFNTIGRHIGNAVPVKLGTVIGKSILNHLKQVKA